LKNLQRGDLWHCVSVLAVAVTTETVMRKVLNQSLQGVDGSRNPGIAAP